MPKISNLTFKDVSKFLHKNNFSLKNSEGSHFIYYSDELNAVVVVPNHGNKSIPPGTMASIIRQSKILRKHWEK
jgi:predicted RNA binding protein YcfA (HicA-like mRNA interferase family)